MSGKMAGLDEQSMRARTTHVHPVIPCTCSGIMHQDGSFPPGRRSFLQACTVLCWFSSAVRYRESWNFGEHKCQCFSLKPQRLLISHCCRGGVRGNRKEKMIFEQFDSQARLEDF